jgi:hypothetical protein
MLVDDLENKNKIYGLIRTKNRKKLTEIHSCRLQCRFSNCSKIYYGKNIIPEHLENSPKKNMSDNFIGLITGGDINNSIQTITWNKELKKKAITNKSE